jgi:hypothetical protein
MSLDANPPQLTITPNEQVLVEMKQSNSTSADVEVVVEKQVEEVPKVLQLPEVEAMQDVRLLTTEQARKRVLAETLKVNVGLHKIPGHERAILVLPKELFVEDSYLAAMFWNCKQEFDLEIRETHAKINPISDELNSIFLGLWLGLYDTDFVRKDKTKTRYELGRTLTFYERIRQDIVNNRNLGEKSLVKDQFFFNNNPTEVVYETKEVYNSKSKKTEKRQIQTNIKVMYELHSLFSAVSDDKSVVDGLLGAYKYLVSLYGTYDIDNDTYFKALRTCLLRYDQIAHVNQRTIFVTDKDGKRVERNRKTPLIPKRNKLFLNAELGLITEILGVLWKRGKSLEKNFFDKCYRNGFTQTVSEVSSQYQVRWNALARFSKVTTRRLQAIRKLNPEKSKIKKRDVVLDDVINLVSSRPDKAHTLVEEVRLILGENTISVLAEYLKTSITDENQLLHVLEVRCNSMYTTEFNDEKKIEEADQNDLLDFNYEQLQKDINCLYDCSKINRSIIRQLSGRMDYDNWKVMGAKLVQVSNLISKRVKYQGWYIDFFERVSHSKEIKEIVLRSINLPDLSSFSNEDEEAKKKSNEFYQTLRKSYNIPHDTPEKEMLAYIVRKTK